MPRNKRDNLAGDGAPLTDNPFGSLGPAGHAPASPAPAPATSADSESHPPTWRVLRARKGGWRMAVEKRAGGKAVTVLSGVEGDAGTLLKALRKHCGAGGATVDADKLEIQGDHRVSIAAWLDARDGKG